MENIKIIIRDDDYIRLYAPLTFAYEYASKGVQVDVLFLNLALLVLTPEGLQTLTVDGRHSEKESWLKERLATIGVPPEIHEFLKVIKQAGKVTFSGCRDSALVLDVEEKDLIPESDGLLDSAEFIKNSVDEGIHCMYF